MIVNFLLCFALLKLMSIGDFDKMLSFHIDVLTKGNIAEPIWDIRRALLEADVSIVNFTFFLLVHFVSIFFDS
jgi:hypothetical protein